MDLVAIAAVGPDGGLVAAAGQQIGHVVQTLAIIAAGILIAGDQVHGDVGGHHGGPFGTFDEVVQLDEVPHQLDGGVKGVEHVAGVVGHHVGIVGDPVGGRVGVLDAVGHAGEDPGEPVAGHLVGIGLVGGAEFLVDVGVLAALPLGAKAAQHQGGDVLAVLGGVGPGQHGTPAVAEHHVGNVGIVAHGDVVEGFFVLNVGLIAAGVGIAQSAAVIACLAVADVVVGVDHEAGSLEFADHVEISAGVLAVAVDDLDDAPGLAQGAVGPGFHGVPAVGGGEADLADRHVTNLLYKS